MRVGQSLSDMLSHARPEQLLDLSALQKLPQLINRGDTPLLGHTQHAPGIESGVLADTGDSWAGLRSQFFQLTQSSGQNDFAKILFFRRKQLGKAGEPVSNLGVTQDSPRSRYRFVSAHFH